MNHYNKVNQNSALPNTVNQWLALIFRLVNIYFIYNELDFFWHNRNDLKIILGVIPVHLMFIVPSLRFQLSENARADPKFRRRMIWFGAFSIIFALLNLVLMRLYRDSIIEIIVILAFAFYTMFNAFLNGSLMLAIIFYEKAQNLEFLSQEAQLERLQPKLIAVPYQYQNLKAEMI
ncbi:unnamed protein product [Moneuplotes crassus]|uniref:Uncharacterized protein n=1 Tax=Euplotes crassus TaxID=5936 RepID=A0AAD1XZT8_EUPCR|nr:unnamed protein product [Moneuplotes crassus]